MTHYKILSIDVVEMYGTRKRSKKERNLWDKIESCNVEIGYHPTIEEILSMNLPLCQIAELMETYHSQVALDPFRGGTRADSSQFYREPSATFGVPSGRSVGTIGTKDMPTNELSVRHANLQSADSP